MPTPDAAVGTCPAAPGRGRGRLLMLCLGVSTAAVVAVLAAPDTSAAPRQLTPPHSAAARTNGLRLGTDPALRPSQPITVTVPGFAPRSAVTVRIACERAMLVKPITDADGVLHLRFAAPAGLSAGQHLLTFTGKPRPAAGSRPAAGTIVVTVPEVAFFPFRIGSGGPQALPARCD